MDDGWKLVDVEPEAVGVNGTAITTPNEIRPMVELVLGKGHYTDGSVHARLPGWSMATAMWLPLSTGTVAMSRPRSGSGRCSRERISWPRNR